ncbi:Serine hydroxymethyltransferase [Methylacidimicrobium cyclopophantes]|uniref:Serine hydroxymethyltransferase n=1 Tax=Methylacidimicrobium cyclopophantes TaxID=1041766 RepID=A0A5E6MCD0_9BACT|nr:serine hydroxymethyltransferase [Methylacidimicrobium cyclopophantes]VVM05940.1 Serine hydroxymethyltransferase [Methylacidimicrobium cyclopophantes]
MKNVLFVCTGNVCRSPMAQGLFQDLVQGRHDIRVDSAGIGAVSGIMPSEQAIDVMQEIGIDISSIRSKPLSADLVRRADFIFCMSYAHLDSILLLYPSASEKTYLLLEFDSELPLSSREIPDPIGSPIEIYRVCRDQMRQAMPKILSFVLESERATQPEEGEGLRIALGSDHFGLPLKQAARDWLKGSQLAFEDYGTMNELPVDYPDYAERVGRAILQGKSALGLLFCQDGMGMEIAANRIPGIRAVRVATPDEAAAARARYSANILCLGSGIVHATELPAILHAWLVSQPGSLGHDRPLRKLDLLGKISSRSSASQRASALPTADPDIGSLIERESRRQSENLELIASENFASRAVMEAQGSCLTNKYAEGYPGRRWYGGCENMDEIERLAIDRAKQLFGAEHVNVQPHSGSQANMAVYFACLQPGDKLVSMDLAHGGHLTHGFKMNFSGRFFQVAHYGVRPEDERIDYDGLAKTVEAHRPRMIVAGASSYPAIIDFATLRQIADTVGAFLFVDMAHVAGLVAAGLHPSPVPYADFVTTTTHKTLRGPRGGMILCRAAYAKEIDAQIFPGIQGGPLMHVIAAKAVCLKEALQPEFQHYQSQVIRNARALAEGLKRHGYRLVTGTTENHLLLVDLRPRGISGKEAQELLDRVGITVNKNAIPFDTLPPYQAGGIRLGTPAVTTRGMRENEMFDIAEWIHRTITHRNDSAVLEKIREEVLSSTLEFPLPG